MKKTTGTRVKGRGRGRGRGKASEVKQPGKDGRAQNRQSEHLETIGRNIHASELSNDVLRKVAREIPKNCYRDVVRTLMKKSKDLPDQIIEEIEFENQKDLNEIKYKCLRKWKLCTGKSATVQKLHQALEENSLKEISEKLTEFLKEEKEESIKVVRKELENQMKTNDEHRRQRYESGRTSPTLSLGFGSIPSLTQDLPELSLQLEPQGITEDTVRALLQRIPSDTLMFKETAADYIEDFKELMIDIVSMWNTPHRGDAHIIIGVHGYFESNDVTTNNQCVGIKHDDQIDNDYYHDLFNEHYFTYIPDFIYTEICIDIVGQPDKKCVGVFTVKHNENKAKTDPCIAQMCLANPDKTWTTGVVWARTKGLNMHAEGDYLDTIYNWFGRPTTRPSQTPPSSTTTRDEMKRFLQHTGTFFDKRTYCLISDCPVKLNDQISVLGLVSWLRVFDFDINSPISGVLKSCEFIIKSRRVLHKTTWREPPAILSTGSTNWYFPTGYKIEHQHVIKDLNVWKTQAAKSVDDNCKQLAEYCTARIPLTILVLWYGKTSYKYLVKLIITHLESYLQDGYKLVLCSKGFSELAWITEQIEDSVHFSNIDLSTVCEAIGYSQRTNQISCGPVSEFELPGSRSDGISPIQADNAVWLKISIEVLYRNHNYQSECGLDTAEQPGLDFLRGGTLTWYELQIGKYDATRDITADIIAEVVNLVKKSKSGIVELYHDPGAGGTTLGRRILWEIHLSNEAPCVNVTNSQDIIALSERIEFLYQKTLRPIVILLDGSDVTFCRQLLKMLENCVVIILLVQRTMSNLERCKGVFYLKGKVSVNEAAHISLAFQKYADSNKILALQNLATKVRENKMHHVYEFGLIVYEEQFRGVRSYVEGYLDYNSEMPISGWHRVLLFLALAYYYGHTSVPAQLFAEILGVNKKSAVTLKHMKRNEFVIEDFENNIRHWRITHYVVAREILEQLLGDTDNRSKCNKGLSCDTKRKIGTLACDFIETAAKAFKGSRSKSSPSIMNVVLSTIILRDQEEDNKQYNRPKISRLISDIKSESPYEERLEVLRKITECFPQNPSGWAHLGRFYGLYRANEIPKATEYTEKAIMLRMEELTFQSDPGAKHKIVHDRQLSHIYHMYGKIYCSEARYIIGNMEHGAVHPHHERDRQLSDPNSEFHTTLERSITSVQLAVDKFTMCRKYVKKGYEQTIDYNSKLSIRLKLIEFINKMCSLEKYLNCKAADQSSKDFIKECFPRCDLLILECHDLVDKLCDEFFGNVNKFNVVFCGAVEALMIWEGQDSVLSRRSKIAAYKLKHSSFSSPIEMINCTDDVNIIIKLHEENINQIYNEHIADIHLDHDVIHWLRTIRSPHCKPKYTIEKVISYIRKWYEIRKSPHAVYYLFTLNALLGIGVEPNCSPGLSANFVEAQRLMQELQQISKLVSKPGLDREWIGKQKGIDRLINRNSLKSKARGNNGSFWKSIEVQQLLEIRHGYIVDSSKRLKGSIDLISKPVGSTTDPMKVSFVPIHNELYGKRFKGQKVAFNLAFTMNCGLKAFNVCKVDSVQCKECNRSYEYSALDKTTKYIHCQCSRGKPIPIRDENFHDL